MVIGDTDNIFAQSSAVRGTAGSKVSPASTYDHSGMSEVRELRGTQVTGFRAHPAR